MKKKRVLIVCQWPLGGIRTYLKYNYEFFPQKEFHVSIIVSPTISKDILENDMKGISDNIVWSSYLFGRNILFFHVFKELLTGKYDLIHSQGFISAAHAVIANKFFRKKHVLTIHGILEDKYFQGISGKVKRFLIKRLFRSITVFHGVGEDILAHLRETFPTLVNSGSKWTVINNGIKTERFLVENPEAATSLKRSLNLNSDTIIFGFFGRFMTQKGFNYIIDAVEEIIQKSDMSDDFIVLAVGSGDFESYYINSVKEKHLEKYIRFVGFNPDIANMIKGCNAVLMPSIWEAYPILSSEVLCSGIPLIATDCIGLREAIKDTPAIVIPPHNPSALADAMQVILSDRSIKEIFNKYKYIAAERFDVRKKADQLIALFRELIQE